MSKGCPDLLRAVFFSSAVMGGKTGNWTVMFKGMVFCLATAFLSRVGSAEGEEDGVASDEEGAFVSRGGMFSIEPDASSKDEPLPPKNSFSFPGTQSARRSFADGKIIPVILSSLISP